MRRLAPEPPRQFPGLLRKSLVVLLNVDVFAGLLADVILFVDQVAGHPVSLGQLAELPNVVFDLGALLAVSPALLQVDLDQLDQGQAPQGRSGGGQVVGQPGTQRLRRPAGDEGLDALGQDVPCQRRVFGRQAVDRVRHEFDQDFTAAPGRLRCYLSWPTAATTNATTWSGGSGRAMPTHWRCSSRPGGRSCWPTSSTSRAVPCGERSSPRICCRKSAPRPSDRSASSI